MLGSPIEEIKSRLDIIDVIGGYIKLQKAGANYRAVCPFHTEKKPSFFVNPARQIWHCFGACGVGGDIFKFVMMIEGVEFGDALRILAQKAGVELKKQDAKWPEQQSQRQKLYEITELACNFFETQLEGSSSGKTAKEYLLQRGVKEESIKKWRLGYAPDVWEGLTNFLISHGYKAEDIEKAGLCLKSEKKQNFYDRFRGRITFPIFDLSSQVIGFGARTLKKEETAKYINSPATLLYDKSRILYGLNKAGVSVRKNNACILVEGYMDAIMTFQAGFENVVATSGTALTSYQLKILKRYTDNLYSCFDMDIAGDSATKRGIDLAQAEDFNIKVVIIPQGKDPAEFIQNNNSESFQKLTDSAKSIHDFYFENALAKFSKDTLEGKKNISKILLPVIKRISNKIEQNVWMKDLAQILQVREEDILEELKKVSMDQNEHGFNQENEQPVQRAVKTRKELLEERLISLFVRAPEFINLVSQDDLKLFSLETVKMIDHLQNKQTIDSVLTDKINCLSLELEARGLDIGLDLKEEFNCCFKELKSLTVKDKLSQICKEIRIAEQEKNFGKVQELVEQFCLCSKSRNDLEIQGS